MPARARHHQEILQPTLGCISRSLEIGFGWVEMAQARVEISKSTNDGRGIAHIAGKVCFVDGALAGEEIILDNMRKKRSYNLANLVRVIKASPQRVKPPCPYHGVCGGCVLQHMDYDAQVEEKEQHLLQVLQRIGRSIPTRVMPSITEMPFGYRRKARLGVRYVPAKGGVLVGFRERNRGLIQPLAACPVMRQEISQLLPALTNLIGKLSCPDRIPQIEVACGDSSHAIVIRHLKPLTASDQDHLLDFASTHQTQLWLQAGSVAGAICIAPETPSLLSYTLSERGLQYFFDPFDFIQVNGPVNERLVELAMEWLELNSSDSILDLFCGLGNFSLPMAQSGARVCGVDLGRQLIARARHNASHNGLTELKFLECDLFDQQQLATLEARNCNKILLDPPRSGAMEAIKSLVATTLPDRIAYVSCNPATLARDAQYLTHELPYQLTHLALVDMFPQTAHIEVIALFMHQ